MVETSCLPFNMQSWIHILIVCFLLIHVGFSQLHVVIDPKVTEELYKGRTNFKGSGGEFLLNETEPQFYRLVLNGSVLYVGGRESLHTVDLASWSVTNTVTFNTSPLIKSSCETKNLLDGVLCYNYVTIIQPIGDCLFVCGTDALSPKCYYVNQMSDTVPNDAGSYSGEKVAPRDPKQNSTWLYLDADDKYFSANGLPVDRTDSDSGFLQANLSTCTDEFTDGLTQFNSPKWLNVPHFVGEPIEYEDFVYFFFREFATEHINAGRVVYSRVARVCKNDLGGKSFTTFQKKFITYQKARLNCSTWNFMYNDIQDVSHSSDKKQVFTVFTTSIPGPTSSAMCVYEMSDIAHVFQTSKYWGTAIAGDLWSNPDAGDVPNPRPGQCDKTYPTTNNVFQAFLTNYPLLGDLVQPILTVVQDNVRYVQVLGEADGNDRTFILGTDRNTIIRATSNGTAVVMIDEVDLDLAGIPQSPILTIIKDNSSLDNSSLYISTEYSVYKLPVVSCPSRDKCFCTKDPYCILNGDDCVHYQLDSGIPGNTSGCEVTINATGSANTITAKNKTRNLNFVASAQLDSNLSAYASCSEECKTIMDEYQKKSVCGTKEILVVQYAVKVEKACTCGVNFTVDGADDMRLETHLEVDYSDPVKDKSCFNTIQSFDNDMLRYKYDMHQWKNYMIKESGCTQSVCNNVQTMQTMQSTCTHDL